MNFQKINQRKKKVICFGEALVDRLGPLGGDPSDIENTKDCLGGAPANVASALAMLGIDVAFVGRLGQDNIGKDFRNLMLERNVDISCLQTDLIRPSRVVLVRREFSGERSFGGFSGNRGQGFADESISLQELEKDWEAIGQDANWLLVGTIPLAYESSSEALLWTIKKAYEEGIKIALDVNWRPIFWNSKSLFDAGPNNLAREKIQSLLEIASLLKLSKEEAIWFFNSHNPLEISNSLPQKPNVVVTDGPNPVQWLLNEFSGTLKVSNSLPVVDTTGAGDAFTAGLIFQLLQ